MKFKFFGSDNSLHLKTYAITTTILLLSTYGGVQFYNPKTAAITTGLFLVLAAVGLVNLPQIDRVYLVGLGVVVISLLLNLDIWRAGLARLLLMGAALGVMSLAGAITVTDLSHGLTWAGWLWPLVVLLGPGDNANILAVWPLVFLLASNSTAQKWLYGVLLIWLGSRGAITGAAVGLAIVTGRRWGWKMIGVTGLAALLLVAWRPHTALYRLGYWAGALRGWASSPLWGVGPGGIGARGLIDQPGVAMDQIHSHNIVISAAAELGLLGLVALAWLAWHIWQRAGGDWQRGLIGAFAAWSMVDEPLFWPGPLLMLAVVVGCSPDQSDTEQPC